MKKTIKDVFDYYFQDVEFNQDFVKRVDKFIVEFLSKNDNHVKFFGSGVIGVYPARWNYSDTDTWWDDIFGVEPEQLQEDLYKTPYIVKSRNVSSDALNHAFIYAIHRVHHSQDITPSEKERIKPRIMAALNMKFLCSLAAHYFKYPADPGIAEKAYNSLSKRFDIKQYGNWGKLIGGRSRDYVSPTGNYYKTYVEYTDDKKIVIMLNDAQGRIRETYKDLTRVYYTVLKQESKILSSSSSVELDGVVMLKDVERKATQYHRYIKNVISARNDYLKDQLQEVVFRAVPSLEPGMYDKLQETLLVKFHDAKYKRHLESMVDNLLTYSFDFIKQVGLAENDLPGILYRLKHNYMSGRITDPALLNARESFKYLVEAMDKKMKNTPLVPERCGIFLYIVLRTLTMNYFK